MFYRLFELIIVTVLVNTLYTVKPVEIPKIVKRVEAKISTVVLLDNGKQENAVMVSTEKGSRNLDNIGGYVDMEDKKKLPPLPKIMPPEEIKKRFANALAIAPKKGISYILYFQSSSMALTNQSEEMLIEAIKMMENRRPCTVDIIGHTDTAGTSKNNMIVSLMRANYVKKLIDKMGVEVEFMAVKGYGEEDLLFATANNIAEAKNRNVEIFIK